MSGRKAWELHHNTPEEVETWLAAALDLVNAAEIDGDLRGIAFAKAIDLLAAKQIQFEQFVPGAAIDLGARR